MLCRRDGDLDAIVRRHGPPPMWERTPGFSTLIHIILEQQVSLASAQAAHSRLLLEASPLTPQRFLQLDDATLRRIGFSRQKTGYGRLLSEALAQGALDLDALARQDDDTARQRLVGIKGIGPWTADIYLLMALRRPDIWPTGDLAIAIAVQEVKRLQTRPNSRELAEMAAVWRPFRAVAARILWHHYLSTERLVSRASRSKRAT